MATSKRRPKRNLAAVTLTVVLLLVGVATVFLIRHIIGSKPPEPKKVVQEVQLIRPPPPPPDQPPPPPPPPEEKVVIPDPQQKPDPTPSNDPPPSEQLGLDAEGGAGGDAFGLLGKKGGRELVGAGGSAFAWYAGLLKGEILQQLGMESAARNGRYSVSVRVWVRADGSIDHVRLVQSSGDRERDRAIESALGRITRLSQSPPADMPQPISLRIDSHG